MKMHKAGVLFLLILTASIPAALLGCKKSGSDSLETTSGASGSGPVSIQKMGGDIEVKDAPQGADLSTMGGNIHLGNVGSFAKVKTMGGNISIDSADASVNATTMAGKIAINQASGPVQATTMAGDIRARLVGSSSSQRDVELTSNSGTIELTVPKDFPMDVRITLAYTKNAPGTFQIVDSIGLTQQSSEDWDTSQGTPRRYIRAKGRVGSGLNHVVIKTINGDVILKQE
jgi:DUF4097 and DUF4098 domain-containing protein YvlB